MKCVLVPLRILDIRCLLAFGPLGDLETDFLSFLQSLEAFHRNRREMRKQIFTATIRSDKSESLAVIEPLYSTSLHDMSFKS